MSLSSLPAMVALIFKIASLLFLSLYALFAGIMVRQEHLMDKVIDETFEPVLHILVFLHFIFAVGLLILAAIIL